MNPHTCCQCGNTISYDDDNLPAHNWGRGLVACDHCHHAAAVQGYTDEPIDEGLAYLDRRDRFHGPWHG